MLCNFHNIQNGTYHYISDSMHCTRYHFSSLYKLIEDNKTGILNITFTQNGFEYDLLLSNWIMNNKDNKFFIMRTRLTGSAIERYTSRSYVVLKLKGK